MLTFPDYSVSACIHESPKSLVYRGIRESDGLPVVMKVLREDYPSTEELSRYQQEYAILQSLHLDGVISTYGLEPYQNTLLLLLEDFGAESLANCIGKLPEGGKAPLSLPQFLWVAVQTTSALGEIHAAGIIHKDINPSNVVCNLDTKQVKIIDFGIASRFSHQTQALKNPAHLEGSLSYLSPEQTGRMNRPLVRQAKLGASCRVKVPVG
jgi:serine/threonine protein kinase